MSRRFVIQFHTTGRGAHYDLMLETDAGLATWQLRRPPADLGPDGMPARRLPDHRAAYLTYEGPVSGGRGAVRIFDGGACRLIECEDQRWVFELRGRRVKGTFTLRRVGSGRWRLLAGDAGPEQSAPPAPPR